MAGIVEVRALIPFDEQVQKFCRSLITQGLASWLLNPVNFSQFFQLLPSSVSFPHWDSGQSIFLKVTLGGRLLLLFVGQLSSWTLAVKP